MQERLHVDDPCETYAARLGIAAVAKADLTHLRLTASVGRQGPRYLLAGGFGVTRNNPPGFASSSIQSAPSGPCSTSRIRCPTLQRSAGAAPPLPSNVRRFSVIVAIPPISAEPLHCGNIAPL